MCLIMALKGFHERFKGVPAVQHGPIPRQLPEVLAKDDAALRILHTVPRMEENGRPVGHILDLKGCSELGGFDTPAKVLLGGDAGA